MTIEEYTPPPPTADYTPRPNASQEVARAKRARGTRETGDWELGTGGRSATQPASNNQSPVSRQWLVAALFGGFSLFVLALSWQLATPARPLALTPVPTEAPAPTAAQRHTTLFIAPTVTSMPVSTPPAVPSVAPEPSGDVLGALQEAPPQTGRGRGEVVPAAPSYIENVGAQVPHCIRTCDGQPGPNGGDWALVPTAEPAMLEVIGRQAPHKVR